jgi:hypothetical protein
MRHPLVDQILDARREIARGREGWDREVTLMIALHHRVRPYRGEWAELVEPFRRPAPSFRGRAAPRRTGRADHL